MTEFPPPPVTPAYAAPPEHPQSTLVLVLGILSIVCCGIFTGIPGIVIGRSALKEVAASGGTMSGGNLKAGLICSIIGTALMVLAIAAYGALTVVVVILGATHPNN